MYQNEKSENSIIQVGFVDVATRKLHFKDHLYRNAEMTFRVSRIGKQATTRQSKWIAMRMDTFREAIQYYRYTVIYS